VAGHSSGAAVAAQLALDHAHAVHTLGLLEMSLLSVPSGAAFLQQAGPAFEAYGNGNSQRAVHLFLSLVSGLPWAACRATIEKGSPGVVAQAVKDADTFFGVELPALTQWEFGAEQAAGISQPVLSVLGSRTEPLWVEVDQFLRSSLPHVESCTVPGVGHLLHGQRAKPVAQAMADFFRQHPLPQHP
jgi:3-oxoadipate enol-lactonase